MFQKILVSLIATLLVNAVYARDSLLSIGNDIYTAGDTVNVQEFGIDNVFAAGRSVSINNNITGSAYLAAENVTIKNSIGQNLYAAGRTVSLLAPILRDAQLSGESIFISSPVANDIRAAGNHVEINNNVGGDLVVAANHLKIQGTIAGSAALAVNEISFSADARIQGLLTVYTDNKKRLIIPSHVIQKANIIYKNYNEFDKHEKQQEHSSIGFLAFITAILVLLAILCRKKTAVAYHRGLASIKGSLGYGFLLLSVLIGAIIVSAITIIAIPLSLLLLFATVLMCLLGYFLGNYLIILHIWQKLRKNLPDTKLHISIATILSVACASLMANVPWLSWFLIIAITFFGIGSITPYRCVKANKNTE